MPDPDAYLAALDDLRSERDHLHPHRPLLERPDARGVARDDVPRGLTDHERELGRRRVAELREQIAKMRRPTPGAVAIADRDATQEDPGSLRSLSERLVGGVRRSESVSAASMASPTPVPVAAFDPDPTDRRETPSATA